MLLKKLAIDGDWIADGYFFKKVEQIKAQKFIEDFKTRAELAKDLELLSPVEVKTTTGDVLLFKLDKRVYMVQTCFLRAIGFSDESTIELYRFTLNEVNKIVFVYFNEALIGGVMIVAARGDESDYISVAKARKILAEATN